MDSIRKTVDLLGGVKSAAAHLDVSHQLVYFWLQGERRFPADKCPLVEKLTGGAVRCEDLRPDVAWGVLREQVVPHQEVA